MTEPLEGPFPNTSWYCEYYYDDECEEQCTELATVEEKCYVDGQPIPFRYCDKHAAELSKFHKGLSKWDAFWYGASLVVRPLPPITIWCLWKQYRLARKRKKNFIVPVNRDHSGTTKRPESGWHGEHCTRNAELAEIIKAYLPAKMAFDAVSTVGEISPGMLDKLQEREQDGWTKLMRWYAENHD